MISKLLYQVSNLWRDGAQKYVTEGLRRAVMTRVYIGVAGLTMTGLILGLRQTGGLQPLELIAFDRMVRLQDQLNRLKDMDVSDPRLLVVAITEADIRTQERWPMPDRALAKALANLQKYQPRAIGLDIYRDVPQTPGTEELTKQLKAPNIIAITKLGDSEDIGVPPPPGMPDDRVGFNDLPSDPDGVNRRNLMFGSTDKGDYYSFSLRLALTYLAEQGIKPSSSEDGHLKLGKAIFVPLENDSGGYQGIDAAGYQILLNYRTRKLARQITLTDLLNGQVNPNWVKGKIVLIGATASSAKDSFLTPYSAALKDNPLMPGVVIHGQMVSQILDAALGTRPLLWFWPGWIEVIWIVGWSVIGSLMAWQIRHPLVWGLITVGTFIVLFAACFAIYLHQGWVPFAAPVLALVTTSGTVVAYRAYQAQRQQQMIMTLLGQNTSPEIAKALWNSRDRLIKSGKLPGQRLTATMLFTDIRDFSSISEQMPPESLLDWLNEYLSAITQEVKAHHGIINKFTGDGMLAVFGVPMSRTNPNEISEDARQAVACALAMGTCLDRLNQDWEKRGLPVVQMRVGIFTGPIVVGSLGGKDRLEYGVIGDSVNTASRLESYEKSRQVETCRVLIAKETLMHIQGYFVVEHWGPLSLKGKQQLVDVYHVLGHQPGQASPLPDTANQSG